MKETKLKNKNGINLKEDDVLFDGKIYWRYNYNEPTDEWYLLSCEKGYQHNLTQEYISILEPIGTLEGNEYLFECD